MSEKIGHFIKYSTITLIVHNRSKFVKNTLQISFTFTFDFNKLMVVSKP